MEQPTVTELAQATALVHKHASAGVSDHGQLCWKFDRKQLQLWSSSDTSRLPLFGHLPYTVSSAVSVSAAQHQVRVIRDRITPTFARKCISNGDAVQDSAGPCAVVATADGNVAVWPNFFELGSQEPLTAHIAEEVTCVAISAGQDASVSVVVGTKAGKLYLLHCFSSVDETLSPTLSVSEVHMPEVRILAVLQCAF